MFIALKSLLAVFIILLFTGCDFSSYEDVSNQDLMFGGYSKNDIYKLNDNVFLLSLKFQEKKELEFALSPEGRALKCCRNYSVPLSIEDFEKDADNVEIITGGAYQVPTRVVGIVKKNSTLKIKHVIRKNSFSWFFGRAVSVTVYGEILSGKFVGQLVNLNDLSELRVTEPFDNNNDIDLKFPNISFIKKIE